MLGLDLAQINSKDIPNVTGVRDKYNVNDTINLNCSSTATNAQLSWLVNGHKVGVTQITVQVVKRVAAFNDSICIGE